AGPQPRGRERDAAEVTRAQRGRDVGPAARDRAEPARHRSEDGEIGRADDAQPAAGRALHGDTEGRGLDHAEPAVRHDDRGARFGNEFAPDYTYAYSGFEQRDAEVGELRIETERIDGIAPADPASARVPRRLRTGDAVRVEYVVHRCLHVTPPVRG